jgi:uncharacterized protein with LGFP repeats
MLKVLFMTLDRRLFLIAAGGVATAASAATLAADQVRGRGAAPEAPQAAVGRPTAAAPPRSWAPRPPIVPRSQWQTGPPALGQSIQYAAAVKAMFIHHTDGGQDYTPAQVPELIRNIFNDHVTNRGWGDIGYNFLVDKYGTIYEGRAGGTDRAVIGAHTLGFNVGSAGVAALGSYDDGAPQALISSIAALCAWKLGLDQVDPTGTVVLTSTDSQSRYPSGQSARFSVISGHTDACQTDCPGVPLYGTLPTIRTDAARIQQAFLATSHQTPAAHQTDPAHQTAPTGSGNGFRLRPVGG